MIYPIHCSNVCLSISIPALILEALTWLEIDSFVDLSSFLNLSERDYNTFMDSYNVMMEVVKQPDLLIYLKSSIEHLVAQIAKRGREIGRAHV